MKLLHLSKNIYSDSETKHQNPVRDSRDVAPLNYFTDSTQAQLIRLIHFISESAIPDLPNYVVDALSSTKLEVLKVSIKSQLVRCYTLFWLGLVWDVYPTRVRREFIN